MNSIHLISSHLHVHIHHNLKGYGPCCVQNTTSIPNDTTLLVHPIFLPFHAHHSLFFPNHHDQLPMQRPPSSGLPLETIYLTKNLPCRAASKTGMLLCKHPPQSHASTLLRAPPLLNPARFLTVNPKIGLPGCSPWHFYSNYSKYKDMSLAKFLAQTHRMIQWAQRTGATMTRSPSCSSRATSWLRREFTLTVAQHPTARGSVCNLCMSPHLT